MKTPKPQAPSGNHRRPGPLQAAILKWLGVPFSLTDEDAVSAIFGGSSNAGVDVTHQAVLNLSAAWACTRLISETIATLPLSMYERTSRGKQIASQHPLNFIIHDQPNMLSTAAVYWESCVAAMMLRGNARSEMLMLDGRLVGLMFLHPDCLTITKRANGTRQYMYTGADGRQREIPADRIFTIPGFSLNGIDGASVIRYGANVFGNAIAAETAAGSTFQNGLSRRTYFSMDKMLTKPQRDEFRENLKVITGALNEGKSPLLEGGMKAAELGINPDDAQLLESRAFSVEEVCRWFRVPPFMVGHSEKSSSWGTGIEQQMIGFLTFTLGPWLKRIEQAISKDLLPTADRVRFYPKFSVEGLLRADSAGRAAFFGAMVNNGIYARDEVRELEDLAPMGGNAAVLTVQSAMVPLDKIGVPSGAEPRT